MSKPQESPLARRRLWPAVTGVTALVVIASAALGFHSLDAEANDVTAVAAREGGFLRLRHDGWSFG